MAKYSELFDGVFSLFGSSEWESESVRTYPSNFTGDSDNSAYIRVHVLPAAQAINSQSASGSLMVDIFTPAGAGPKDTAVIADSLDKLLLGRSHNTQSRTLQIANSSVLSYLGVDSKNPALYRALYTVSFNLFGAA